MTTYEQEKQAPEPEEFRAAVVVVESRRQRKYGVGMRRLEFTLPLGKHSRRQFEKERKLSAQRRSGR